MDEWTSFAGELQQYLRNFTGKMQKYLEAVKNQNSFLSNIGLNLGHALASFALRGEGLHSLLEGALMQCESIIGARSR